MSLRQRGSLLGSVVGILACGVCGGVFAFALVAAAGLDGVPGALAAAVLGMIVATALWVAGSSLLRAMGLLR